MPFRVDLSDYIKHLERNFSSSREAAKAYGIDAAYWCRLRNGVKSNPSEDTCRKLGVTKVVTTTFYTK